MLVRFKNKNDLFIQLIMSNQLVKSKKDNGVYKSFTVDKNQ